MGDLFCTAFCKCAASKEQLSGDRPLREGPGTVDVDRSYYNKSYLNGSYTTYIVTMLRLTLCCDAHFVLKFYELRRKFYKILEQCALHDMHRAGGEP
jgi:hypothetical protein